jgi:hypothetical protein
MHYGCSLAPRAGNLAFVHYLGNCRIAGRQATPAFFSKESFAGRSSKEHRDQTKFKEKES